ncbi:DUF4870 domain-containing protein [Guptibacillus algicola]|uniref:DUF4870 domain-containing protein n=1 Tax=Guptibacillus algicola TaxID=225844 RepID=UPI001CD62E67|nr:DUF4870 domain-containing protein [Alkalihalobacillus algicola]MCA0989113.1 DUF4870 domain-containing protein [Alkalihalobacillus algicola]
MEQNDIQLPDEETRSWAMFAHLSALSGYLIPFGNIIAPLIIWSIKKDVHPFINEQAKEALNFQICMTVYGIIAGLLTLILIGFILLPVIFIIQLVFIIIASVKANQGEDYRYPLTFRMIS